MLPLTSAALGIRHSTYDAGALYDSVLQVTVDGEPRCAATIVASRNSSSTSLAISAASCFLKTAVLSREQQADCLRGTCSSDIIVPASSIHLVGGPDSREAPIVARVKRLAVRFTAWWAMADVCSSALCGEGWDVALLELEQGCESGAMPCVPAVGLPTAAPSFGLFTLAVGYGEAPEFDRRAEWDLALDDGSGVRRYTQARVTAVLSQQLLEIEGQEEAEEEGKGEGEGEGEEGEEGAGQRYFPPAEVGSTNNSTKHVVML